MRRMRGAGPGSVLGKFAKVVATTRWWGVEALDTAATGVSEEMPEAMRESARAWKLRPGMYRTRVESEG